jgi:hypothetical protein
MKTVLDKLTDKSFLMPERFAKTSIQTYYLTNDLTQIFFIA